MSLRFVSENHLPVTLFGVVVAVALPALALARKDARNRVSAASRGASAVGEHFAKRARAA